MTLPPLATSVPFGVSEQAFPGATPSFHLSDNQFYETILEAPFNLLFWLHAQPFPLGTCRTIFLGQKSQLATKDDLLIADDLLDTLRANAKGCVGMAANMIGVKKNIIAFNDEGNYTVMFDPRIIKCSSPYEAEEGGLSLGGIRKTKRYSIKVQFQNREFQMRIKTYTEWTAQMIQHEIDHCNGIAI